MVGAPREGATRRAPDRRFRSNLTFFSAAPSVVSDARFP